MVSRLLALLLLAATPACAESLDAVTGRALFERPWISAPSSQRFDSGLGPLYDARSCESCHRGAGAGPVGEIGTGMVLRLGRADGAGDPVYGHQLQTRALPGFKPEGTPVIQWVLHDDLRSADIALGQLHYGPLDSATHVALRRAPSLHGLATLASVPESEILARAKQEARGVAGQPAWLNDKHGHRMLGRFGWKSSTFDLTEQVALAFQVDFGISTSLHPDAGGECTPAQKTCYAVHRTDVELPDSMRDLIVAYLDALPPPPPRDETRAGYAIFARVGCADCHATLHDADGAPLHAYSDLLLHDMGPGLDDGIAEGGAGSSQWRTAPLWDIADSLRAGGLLHDGRARSIAEAVAWHGGEASRARRAFNALSPNEHRLLEQFLTE